MSSRDIFHIKEQNKISIEDLYTHKDFRVSEEMGKQFCPVYPSFNGMQKMLYNISSDDGIVTSGNKIKFYYDGIEKFEQLIKDIDNAESYIHFQYYIFRNDKLGTTVIEALERALERGLEVLVLYDPIGGRGMTSDAFDRFKSLGGEVITFFGTKPYVINFKLNYRNHRKVVVIDGKLGYLGGYNVGDEYLGTGPLGYWRDTHMRIQGEAVKQLQSVFIKDWNAARKDRKLSLLDYSKDYFPNTKYIGDVSMQIVTSGPDDDREQIKMGFIKMISTARESIYIQTPYFIPDEAVFDAIDMAAKSGVKISIMIPDKPDHPIVYRATEYYAKIIMQENVDIYRYDGGFLHTKNVIVDDKVATVGTANFDPRSFGLNFEVNAFIYDEAVSKELLDQYAVDLSQSTLLTTEYFDSQPWHKKLRQVGSRMLSPIL